MTKSRQRRRPKKATHAVVLAGGLAAMGAGCNAPAMDGPQMALLPVRMFYVPKVSRLFDDDARVVEDAVRVSYAVVQCMGTNAAAQLSTLKTLANANSDSLSRVKNRIYMAKSGANGLVKSCAIIGDDLLSIGSFSAIFASKPATTIEYQIQQWIWLSVRDGEAAKNGSYGETFLEFLGENLGGEPSSVGATANAIAKLDSLYNPCASGDPGFDKSAVFSCSAGQPTLTGDIRPVAHSLSLVLASKNDKFLGSIDAKSGLAAAAKVKSTVGALSVSHNAPLPVLSVSFAAQKAYVPPFDESALSPERRALAARVSGLQKIFGLTVGANLSPVVSVKNPRPLPLPPQLGNGKLAMIGSDDLSTLRAVQMSDGTYAVPNPSLGSDAKIQQRWERWKFVANTGWTLVGHKGMPLLSPPNKSSALASLARAKAATSAGSFSSLTDQAPREMTWETVNGTYVGNNDLLRTESAPVNTLNAGALTLANNDISYAITGAGTNEVGTALGGAANARPVTIGSFGADGSYVEGSKQQVTEVTDPFGVSRLVAPDGTVTGQYTRGLDGQIPQDTLNQVGASASGLDPAGATTTDMTELNALNNELWTGDPNRAPDPIPDPDAPQIDTSSSSSPNDPSAGYLAPSGDPADESANDNAFPDSPSDPAYGDGWGD